MREADRHMDTAACAREATGAQRKSRAAKLGALMVPGERGPQRDGREAEEGGKEKRKGGRERGGREGKGGGGREGKGKGWRGREGEQMTERCGEGEMGEGGREENWPITLRPPHCSPLWKCSRPSPAPSLSDYQIFQ